MFGLPVYYKLNNQKVSGMLIHDKKADDNSVSVVYVDKIGTCKFKKMTIYNIISLI